MNSLEMSDRFGNAAVGMAAPVSVSRTLSIAPSDTANP